MHSALRPDIPGMPQHLWIRGNNRLPCFFEELDRHVYLGYLNEASIVSASEVHAYVLMTNHVHLLATGREPRSLSRLMQAVNRRYSRYFNKAHERTGTLYESRYRSSLVQTERYFFALMRYIELNPVRAGMVQHPGGYPWSSYRQNALGAPAGVLTAHPLYCQLGTTPSDRSHAYRRLFSMPMDDDTISEIRTALKK